MLKMKVDAISIVSMVLKPLVLIPLLSCTGILFFALSMQTLDISILSRGFGLGFLCGTFVLAVIDPRRRLWWPVMAGATALLLSGFIAFARGLPIFESGVVGVASVIIVFFLIQLARKGLIHF